MDDSLFIIEPNHPMIEISDDSEDESKIKKIKIEKKEVSFKQIRTTKIKNENNYEVDSKPSRKRIIEIAKNTKENPPAKKIKSESELQCLFLKKEKNKRNNITKSAKNLTKQLKELKNEDSTLQAVTVIKNLKILPKMNAKPETSSATLKKDRQAEISWEASMLADWAAVEITVATNVINLFENECSIPFIARYRREGIKNTDIDKLRLMKHHYENIKILRNKAAIVIKKIKKTGNLTPQLENSIYNVRSLDELEYIYEPFKKGSARTKAERARSLGFEDLALRILRNVEYLTDFQKYVHSSKEGYINVGEIREHVQNIIADIFAKDKDTLKILEGKQKDRSITIKSTRLKNSKQDKTAVDVERKFEIYYDFQISLNQIQPHQILALNRGEKYKVLSIKLLWNNTLHDHIFKFICRKWNVREEHTFRWELLKNSFENCYSQRLVPLLTRKIRSQMTREAHYAAIENFALNLRSLLRTAPVKGCSILGIDPGYSHGNKMALISETGEVLMTHIFYFDDSNCMSCKNLTNMNKIKQLLILNNCELIALGNGSGVRQIEKILTQFIKKGFFLPDINLKYTIVNERGASIYSVSDAARKEFPDMDPNLISAVFIARSLQDPLNEYVKVNAHNLGVGMYQHDINEKQLSSALDEIVQECVCFAGVDVNTASVHLLKRIAGLGEVRATHIIHHREQNGPFINRQQLLSVKGIGPKIFEQCSGFLRILAETATNQNLDVNLATKDLNPLDRTWIHPESYRSAEKLIVCCGLKTSDLGTSTFIDKLIDTVNKEGLPTLAAFLEESEFDLSVIIEALSQPRNYDYRSQFTKPVFREGIQKMSNLKLESVLTGVVSNVTNFGAFVDVGIQRDGLIHKSQLQNINLNVGDKVEIKVIQIDCQRNRISFTLLRKLC